MPVNKMLERIPCKAARMKTQKRIVKKGFVNILLLTAVVIVLLFAGYASGFIDIPAAMGREKLLPIYSVDTEEKKISISFDAAWGNSHTRPVLDILDKYGIKTTFFLVAFWAEKYPEDLKEISRRGHEVQNHSATHPDMTTLSAEKIREEVETTEAVIEKLTGVKSNLFRPPFGAYNNKVIETLEGLGYKVIQWSVDSLDWKDISADEIVARVVSGIEPGAIVLFHNDAAHVEEYLPQMLEKLIESGYEIVPVGELIYWNDYHMDHTGKQIAK